MPHSLLAKSLLLVGLCGVSAVTGCASTSQLWDFGKAHDTAASHAEVALPSAYAQPAAPQRPGATEYSAAELASWRRGGGGYTRPASASTAANCFT